MAVYRDMNKIEVGVFDKVKEYYRVDRKLGGLIKVFTSVYIDRIGREISVVIPELDKHDKITVNGIEYIPTNKSKEVER